MLNASDIDKAVENLPINWIRFMESQGIDFSGKKVLDVGCGVKGVLAERLRQRGADVYAIDSDEGAVSNLIATGMFSADHIKCCAAEDLANGNPFGHKFDVVMCSGLTQYLSQEGRRQMVHGICHHCLVPQGEVAINIPNKTRAVPFKDILEVGRDHLRELQDKLAVASKINAPILLHDGDAKGRRADRNKRSRAADAVRKQDRDDRADNRRQAGLIGAMFSRYCDDVKPFDAGEICYVCRKLKPEAMHPKGADAKSLKHDSLLDVIARNDFTPVKTGVQLCDDLGESIAGATR